MLPEKSLKEIWRLSTSPGSPQLPIVSSCTTTSKFRGDLFFLRYFVLAPLLFSLFSQILSFHHRTRPQPMPIYGLRRGRIGPNGEASVVASNSETSINEPSEATVYIPRDLQLRYPQLWVLNDALQKIYKGQKVPEHIRGSALIRHFFTFDVLSNNKHVATVVRFTKHSKTLYELSQSHENWMAASDQGSTTRLTYISPAYVLAGMCAFSGAIPPPCQQYWHFYEWMLHDSSSWPNRMPAFWKHSKFDNANWIQSHFGPESWFRVKVPKLFKELEVDAWLGPGRRKRDTVDWRGSDYGRYPEYHQDWETILRDSASTIKPPAWIKAAVNSSGGTYANTRFTYEDSIQTDPDDSEPGLLDDDAPKPEVLSPSPGTVLPIRTPTPALSGGRLEEALSEALGKGAWQEAIELAKRRLREIERSYDEISPDNLAAVPQMISNLLEDLPRIMKAGRDALTEELEDKNRAIAILIAERDKIEQSIASSRQGQQDCQTTIAKICTDMADRTRRLAQKASPS